MFAAADSRGLLTYPGLTLRGTGSVHVVNARALDHVALWVADRDTLADFVCGHLGMHVIDCTDDFTLVGADARRGKLTLFAAEGPREPRPLVRVVLRVRDLEQALEALPDDVEVDRPSEGLAEFVAPEGLGLGLVAAPDTDLDYDIDHVVLAVPDPARSADRLATLGFERHRDRLTVGDKWMRLERGDGREAERPLLNHIALLVDSGDDQLREAERRGLDVAEVRDAANTFAVFLWGPDRIKLEYVEHKPGFALV
jgi:catechol 2,3-dioxygenase-like lactoylglutathione lyase family enzyme